MLSGRGGEKKLNKTTMTSIAIAQCKWQYFHSRDWEKSLCPVNKVHCAKLSTMQKFIFYVHQFSIVSTFSLCSQFFVCAHILNCNWKSQSVASRKCERERLSVYLAKQSENGRRQIFTFWIEAELAREMWRRVWTIAELGLVKLTFGLLGNISKEEPRDF